MNETKNKLRSFAGKGLAVILSVLLLCIFFSGTVKTITTPKVRLTGVSNGRLKDTVNATGYLHFAETEEIGIRSLPDAATLTITELYVSSGQYVRAGDTLFVAEVTDYADRMKALTEAYSTACVQLLNHQRNAVHFTRSDERWFAAYDEVIAAQDNLLQVQLHASEDAAALEAAQQQLTAAKEKFDAADRRGVDASTYAYRTEYVRLQNELAALTEEMLALKTIQENVMVTAPHDGYIVSIAIGKEDRYDGKKPVLVMSGENADCMLRTDVSGSTRKVKAGMSAVLMTQSGNKIRTDVTQTGYDRNGILYADVAIRAEDFGTMGGASNLMAYGTTVTINYAAENSTMQLPISAIRNGGTEQYVYTVTESENIFGTQVLTLKKQLVTVLDESDTMASITGLSQDAQVAYMEDRALGDGMEVMIYGSTP